MRGPSHPAVVAALTDPELPARFWALVDLPTDYDPSWPHGPNDAGAETPCWLWSRGSRDRDQFGVLSLRSHPTGAARIALCLGEAHGHPRMTDPAQREFQLGGLIRAACGHRDCVRPSHLRLSLSAEAERVMLDRFGCTSVTRDELPAGATRTGRRRSPTPRVRPDRAPVAVVERSSDRPDIAPALTPSRAILPDGRALVIAVAMQFRSGSFLVYTPWGPFDGATIAEATAAALAGHPDAAATPGSAAA